MQTKDPCVFCHPEALEVVAENDLAMAVRDKYPVKPLHTLIIPKRHSTNVFDTTPAEREAMHQLAQACFAQLQAQDPSIEGLNFGSNIGAVAGQKIFHTHLHLIPRRKGDLDPPPARQDS